MNLFTATSMVNKLKITFGEPLSRPEKSRSQSTNTTPVNCTADGITKNRSRNKLPSNLKES